MSKLKSPITLRCSRCNTEMEYSRTIDRSIPNSVKTIVSICPKCDDGDFHEERWLDVCGGIVLQGACA